MTAMDELVTWLQAGLPRGVASVRFWAWYLRGTWAIVRSGGSPALVCTDIAAGVRWWRRTINTLSDRS